MASARMIHFIPQTANSCLALSLVLLLISIPSRCQLKLFYYPESPNNAEYVDSDVIKLLSSLSSKASTTSFATETYGKTIYALFLCRGDVSNEECSTCIATACVQFKRDSNCSQRVSTIAYSDKCMWRYSYQNFFGTLDVIGLFSFYGFPTTYPIEPSDAVARIHQLISEASREEFMFKAVVWDDSDKSIYGLAQCTRDINNTNCNLCLTTLLNLSLDEQRKNTSLTGTVVLQAGAPNCYFRIDTSPFFNLASLTPHQPPPDEQGKNRRRIAIITVSMVALVAVLLGIVYCLFRCRNKRRGTGQY